MTDNWQAGDLALCVNPCGTPTCISKGAVVTVSDTMPETDRDWPSLRFVGVRNPRDGAWGWLQTCFRKIEPHAPDAEDEETIALYNQPARKKETA